MATANHAVVVNGGVWASGGETHEPPKVVQELHGVTDVEEGDAVHLEAVLAPAKDNSLQVQWYKDGQPLSAGSRFNTHYDRGFVSLDILYTFPEDSGQYHLVATSKFGAVQSHPIAVRIAAEVTPQVYYPAQESVLDTVRYDESEDRHKPKEAPQFVRAPPAQVQVNEGQPVHAEVRVTPNNDATMHVDWIKDGAALINGSRFNITFDRGLCFLDIAYSIPEDSGHYVCIARNALGEVQSSPMVLTCIGGASIVTDSHLPEGSVAYQRLKALDEESSHDGPDFRYMEHEEPPAPPKFDVLPASMYAGESGPARFLVRISGHPTPELQWFLNEQPVVVDPNHKIFNDGPINCMEIHRCEVLGEIQMRVVAQNALGQAEAKAVLTVVPMEDFRPDLKHITPENPYKKMMTLKKVEVSEELQTKLKKPKASAETILHMEQEGSLRSQLYKSPDVAETEQLYDKVASSLRKYEPGQGYVKPQ